MKFKYLVVLVALLSFACATNKDAWKNNMATGYEVTGILGTKIKETAAPLCTSGTITPANCDKLLDLYNKLRAAYKTAGASIIVAYETSDSLQQQQSLTLYTTAMKSIATLLPKFIELAKTLGIKVPMTASGAIDFDKPLFAMGGN